MTNYTLIKIDLLDAFIFADIFDEEKYQIVSKSDHVDSLIPVAIQRFKESNPQFKNWEEWMGGAEDGGYEFEILREYSSIFRVSILLIDPIVENALRLAMKWHSGHIRKAGSDTDMTHLLQVSNSIRLIDRVNPDKYLITSAFCHDLLEDTECTEDEILDVCGAEVLRIVKACSNDKELKDKKQWEDKKAKYIKTVEAGGEKAMLISLADKIANLKTLIELHKERGEIIWSSFNRGKEQKLWFEKSVLDMLKKHINNNQWIKEYEDLIHQMEIL